MAGAPTSSSPASDHPSDHLLGSLGTPRVITGRKDRLGRQVSGVVSQVVA
jgi:hypothetical protein